MKINKRLCSVVLLVVMLSVLALPCFGATVVGSGTKLDPYVSDSGRINISSAPLPVYFKFVSTGTSSQVYCSSRVFEAENTYYLYSPYPDSNDVMTCYLYGTESGPVSGGVFNADLTRVYHSDNWNVFSFTPSSDAYGWVLIFSNSGDFTYYFDDSLHEPYEYGGVAQALFGSFLTVGSSLLSWVMTTPLLLISVTAFVVIFGIGLVRRQIKGV